MAIGDPYATLDELKQRLDIADTNDDDRLTAALDSASREIEAWCDRQFHRVEVPSVRLFRVEDACELTVDDFYSTTGMLVDLDYGRDGTYGQAWTTAEYLVEPLNGMVNGLPGWPYTRLVTVAGYRWPAGGGRRPAVRVTALWGWAEVPTPVHEACLIMASETFKAGDAPFGVAGFGEFGAVRVGANPLAMAKLGPYRRMVGMVA